MRTEVATMIAPVAIVYDADCAFCRRNMAWIQARARDGLFEFVPSKSAGLLERFPALASHELASGLRAVLPGGRVAVGADAVYEIASRLDGWRWPAKLYLVPGLRQFARGVYGWIAARRYKLRGAAPAAEAMPGNAGPKCDCD